MSAEKVSKISSKCKQCGNLNDYEVPMSEMDKLRKSLPLDRLEISPELKRVLSEHLCLECQGVS